MAESIDDDTLAAVVALWKSDQANLAAMFPRGLETGRLKSTPEAPLPMPYAQVECVVLKPAKRYTGGARLDYRKVTITVRGVKADVVKALGFVLTIFNSQMGAPGKPRLAYPSQARFIAWWPLNDGALEQEPTTREGLDVWRGTVEAEVRSVRTD